MRVYSDISELHTDTAQALSFSGETLSITNEKLLRNTVIDNLVYSSSFSKSEDVKKEARKLIFQIATGIGRPSRSIHDFYMAVGRGEVSGFTVPAMNIRMLTYDAARLAFTLANKYSIGPMIFEIARSEQKYTEQQPAEYTASILAGAIKEGYTGPVFLQGDHYQFSKRVYSTNKEQEINTIKKLIQESIEAGFYNIDIDASTLVDLTKSSLTEQQRDNYEMTALLTQYIRSLQPKGITISIGGEIGHIGGKNSSPEEFEAFMQGYMPLIQKDNLVGISKVSVQTGTSHGGTVLPDGSIAQVDLDFSVLKSISEVARRKYHIGGSVQHGASTLPNELFNHFPESNTLEIHLATGFQNIVYDNMPEELRNEMYEWVRENCQDEKEEKWNDEQFVYKCRKKALGPFKEQLWNLSEYDKKPILDQLGKQFEFLFEKLKVFNTKEIVGKYIH